MTLALPLSLTLLALLTLALALALPGLPASQLLHLFLQLFRFTTQHLLLPALLRALLLITLLLSQLLLPARELFELLQSVIQFLLTTIG